jgi:hypothetical protein
VKQCSGNSINTTNIKYFKINKEIQEFPSGQGLARESKKIGGLSSKTTVKGYGAFLAVDLPIDSGD